MPPFSSGFTRDKVKKVNIRQNTPMPEMTHALITDWPSAPLATMSLQSEKTPPPTMSVITVNTRGKNPIFLGVAADVAAVPLSAIMHIPSVVLPSGDG